MATVNTRITLAARPVGFPEVSDFQLVYSPLPSPAAGEVLVRAVYLSLDSHTRCRMSDGPSALAIGEVMPGGAAGFVVESQDTKFRAGDAVQGILGWQEYAVVRGAELRKLDLHRAPISTALGLLGLPGLTAYFGLLDICDPRRGETVVVSGAAGAVGMIAGQLAKLRGCRVVGVVCADAGISWLLDEMGFDSAFNSMTDVVHHDLEEHCPDGIDVYFDTVGGAFSDAVMKRINGNARVSVAGQTSQYNLKEPELGSRWLDRLMLQQASVQGFLVAAYATRFHEGLEQLAAWLKQGKVKYREEVARGIEAAPQAFIGLLQGKTQGKQLVQLSEMRGEASMEVPQ